MEINSRSAHDESALFDEDEEEDEIILKDNSGNGKKEPQEETSKQRLLSAAKVTPVFQGLRTSTSGQNIQDIKELMTVPVSYDRLRPYTRLCSPSNPFPRLLSRPI